MAKSSFTRPTGAKNNAPAPAGKPQPSKPAAANKPAPAAKPAPSKPTPATKPAPAQRGAPAQPSKPTPATKPAPAQPSRPAPAAARPQPAAQNRPQPQVPAGVRTNVGQPRPTPQTRPAPAQHVPGRAGGPSQRPQPRQPSKPAQQCDNDPTIEAEAEVVDNGGNVGQLPQLTDDNVVHDERSDEQVAGAELSVTVQQNLMTTQLGQGIGEMRPSDFEFPKLKIAQSTGPLFEAGYTPGDIVFNDSTIIWQPECYSVAITILRYVKQWVEDIPYGSEEMPRIYNNSAEAENDGLSTQWGPNGEKPAVLPQLLCMVLIELPDGVQSDEFDIEYGDKRYAIALWRLSGTSYKLVKAITGAQRTRLRNGLHTGSFQLSANFVKGKMNSWYAPVLQPGTAHDPEFIQFIEETAGQN